MDAKSMWNRSEGVVVVVQRQEDFVKRCEPKQPSMEKPSFLSFHGNTRSRCQQESAEAQSAVARDRSSCVRPE